MPRSKVYPDSFKGITVKQGASIGANATLLPGITIGRYAMIGAGSVVTRDVPERAVVVGNPAKIIRYLDQ
ncbi:dTDP-3-amino-3,6-dideoxy-alpha-D-galactopyranose 3-N-acetyltransferase [compost metagenome]